MNDNRMLDHTFKPFLINLSRGTEFIDRDSFIRLRNIIRPLLLDVNTDQPEWPEDINLKAKLKHLTYDQYLWRLMVYLNHGFRNNSVFSIDLRKEVKVKKLILGLFKLGLIDYVKGTTFDTKLFDNKGKAIYVGIKPRIKSLVDIDGIGYLKNIPLFSPEIVKFINATPRVEKYIEDDGYQRTLRFSRDIISVTSGEDVRRTKRRNKHAKGTNATVYVEPGEIQRTNSPWFGVYGEISFNTALIRNYRQPREDYTNAYLQRTHLGGRYYNIGVYNYQTMPKELRKKILHDKEPTVELDLKCLHTNIAYTMAGIPHMEKIDHYRIFNDLDYLNEDDRLELRGFMKMPLIATLSTSNKPQFRKVLDYHYQHNYIQLRLIKEYEGLYYKQIVSDLVKRIEAKHPFIKHLMYKAQAGFLQYHDSEIMRKIMDRCMYELKIMVQPVHDSVIFKAEFESEVKQIMHEVYSEQSKLFSLDGKEYQIEIT